MAVNISLKEELQRMDEKYGDQMYKMYGPTLLGFPQGVDSSRLYMFTAHLKQCLTLLNPDVPKIQTGFENVVGKYNRAFKSVVGKWKVVDRINKFGDKGIYILVLYNKKTDTYDMIEKIVAEDLTEKFGFVYNTDRMDSLQVGDVIKDEVLYKSTSYDDNMNYRYGKNAKVMYSTSNDTLEDAFVIRKSWANNVKSVETDVVQATINENDVLLNIYGNEETYLAFPGIGQMVDNSTICATRRINKDHLLYDFQPQNMRQVVSTDIDYFVPCDSEVYDIDIFYNGDGPLPTNIFYGQIREYYDQILAYSENILNWTNEIKNSGSNYTDNVTNLRARYLHFGDPEYKWKSKDKAFNNLIIEFRVKSVVSLDCGSKITGRYGDKGVISRIVEDTRKSIVSSILDGAGVEATPEEIERMAAKMTIVDDDKMPYTDKFPVDILANMSGSTRRLNPDQIYETELTFIGNEIQDKIKTFKTLAEKEEMVFKFLSMVNDEHYNFFYRMYSSFDRKVVLDGKTIRLLAPGAKEEFIDDVEKNGFYLVKPPHSCIRYDAIKELYKEFDFIKPLPVYIDIFGMKKRRVILDAVIGDKYMLILKQNPNKNFSARSTFRVNRANLPAKDVTKRTNRSSYARSPIRLSEIYNLMGPVSGRTMSEFNIFMRSSTLGRKSLESILATNSNPLGLKKLKVKDNHINANADIFNARLRSIGLRINYLTEQDKIPTIIEDIITPMNFGRYTIYDSPLKRNTYAKLFSIHRKFLRSVTIIETYIGEREDIAWKYVFDTDEVKEMEIDDSIKNMLINTTKGTLQIAGSSEDPTEDEETLEGE